MSAVSGIPTETSSENEKRQSTREWVALLAGGMLVFPVLRSPQCNVWFRSDRFDQRQHSE